MLQEIEKYVKEIEKNVFLTNNKDIEIKSELRENPEEVVHFVLSTAKIIGESEVGSGKYKRAVELLKGYVLPKNINEFAHLDTSIMYEYHPDWFADTLIEACENIINILKNQKSDYFKKIKKEFYHKFLYFNGDEEGGQIIYIDKITNEDDELYFDGSMIRLTTENNDGLGFLCYPVDNYAFDDLYYIEEPSKCNFDEIEDPYERLYKQLSSYPIDTDMKTRVLTKGQLRKFMKEYTNDTLEMFLDENCYE